jgi:hypothetical protein
MSANRHEFSVLPYVPNRFVWGFVCGLIVFYGMMSFNYWIMGIGGLFMMLALTTRYGVTVHVDEKWFKEYVWVLGLKLGERVKYTNLEYLFIGKGKVTQTTSSRVQTTTVTRDEYRGFIKFDGDEKIHILTNSSQEKLVRAMTKTAQIFQTKLFDYSSGQAVQIS